MAESGLPCGFEYPTYRCNMPEAVHRGEHPFQPYERRSGERRAAEGASSETAGLREAVEELREQLIAYRRVSGRSDINTRRVIRCLTAALASDTGPALGPRESTDGPHMPRPTDICTVCGNGLIHIDSFRDPSSDTGPVATLGPPTEFQRGWLARDGIPSAASSETASQGAETTTAGLDVGRLDEAALGRVQEQWTRQVLDELRAKVEALPHGNPVPPTNDVLVYRAAVLDLLRGDDDQS